MLKKNDLNGKVVDVEIIEPFITIIDCYKEEIRFFNMSKTKEIL